MNTLEKYIFVLGLFLFVCNTSFAQAESLQKDTLKIKVRKTESTGNVKGQNKKEFDNKQIDKVNNNEGSQSVKQVKSTRPDLSKARGARPPDIVRPTGSRIPRGIGKPTGLLKPGRG
jgi:hypothetical protein